MQSAPQAFFSFVGVQLIAAVLLMERSFRKEKQKHADDLEQIKVMNHRISDLEHTTTTAAHFHS